MAENITNDSLIQRRCADCNAPRNGGRCWKCGADTFMPAPGWTEPALPSIDRIRELAREVGYAIGVHGSQERDLDLIAAPWTDSAIGNAALLEHIAAGIGAGIIEIERKPLGRYAATLQMEGWYKDIDISVCPTPTKSVVPEGMVMVPREPTDKMLDDGFNALAETHRRGPYGECGGVGWNDAEECYRAMIQAAPTATEKLAPANLAVDTDVSVSGGLIEGAIIATSAEADFSKGTWTFTPKGEWSVGAGDYYLIPIKSAPNDGAEGE